MKWADEYRVHYYYTDYNNILKPGYIARYMQETAWNALKSWGPSPDYLRENNLAFILSKIGFRYYQEIREDDIIKVETWAIEPSRSVVFTRNYRIYKGGGVAAEATSAWALMDMRERAILKPEALGDRFKGFDCEELGFAVQRRLKIPEGPAELREYRVKYADIDSNCHMNNAAYIDLVSECMYGEGEAPGAGLRKQVLEMGLNYNSEAVFGDVIAINKIAAKDGEREELYIAGEVGGRSCFEARAVIKVN